MISSNFEADKLKIMVAESNSELRIIIKNYLIVEGYSNLIMTENGKAAWAKMRLSKPDLIITEIEIPEMSGLELLAAIRGDKTLKTTPVLLIASEVKQEIVAKAAELGVDGYIVKPFSHQTLADKVDKIFRRRFSPSISFMTSQKGDELLQSGDLEGALDKYKDALTATKESMAVIHYKVGGVYEKLSDEEEAENNYKEAVSMSHLHVDSLDALGRLTQSQGRSEESAEYMKASVSISPLNAERQFKLGEALLESDNFEEAEKAFKKSLKMDPRQTHIFNRLGISLRKQNKLAESSKFFERALSVTTDDENLYFNAAQVQFLLKKKDDALPLLYKALEIRPDFNEATRLIQRIKSG